MVLEIIVARHLHTQGYQILIILGIYALACLISRNLKKAVEFLFS